LIEKWTNFIKKHCFKQVEKYPKKEKKNPKSKKKVLFIFPKLVTKN
jgi:hypothetical protein